MVASAREFFRDLAARPGGRSERTRGLRASYRFEIEDAGSWVVRVDDGAVSVEESDAAADCVMKASERTFLRIVNRELNAMAAYLTGKVKISGDQGLAFRLRDLLS